MAPPRIVCSTIAEFLQVKEQVLQTISDIRAVISRIIKAKQSILYGIIPVVDAAVGQAVNAATTVANTVAQQVVSQASSFASSAIEQALAPLLKILMTGPEAIFSLVTLPLDYAIKATDREAQYLSKAKAHLNIVISIFSKWTVEMGGGPYVQKMYDALPYLESALRQCDSLIRKLESDIDSGLSAQFDQRTYNSLQSSIAQAIEITMPTSEFIDSAQLQSNIERATDRGSEDEIVQIKSDYREARQKASREYQQVLEKVSSRSSDFGTAADVIEAKVKYSYDIKRLDEKRRADIEYAKLKAKKDAILSSSSYAGITRSKTKEFTDDMAFLGTSLQAFVTNIAKAYVQNRDSQLMTISTYDIRRLINVLIEKTIDLIGMAGNGAGTAVSVPLLLARELVDGVHELYTDSIQKFANGRGEISTTGLASNLAAGNGALITARNGLAASITQTLIDLINSDELLQNQQQQMNSLFENIEGIPDWDGVTGKWGVNLADAATPPYARLISSTTALLSTMVTVGLMPGDDAIAANRNALIRNQKAFSAIARHNSWVSGALRSYYPPSSPYVDEFKKAMASIPSWVLKAFLSGPSAFNAISLTVNIAGDKISEDIGDVDIVKSCKISYPGLFEDNTGAAEAIANSEYQPVQYRLQAAAYMEESEIRRLSSRSTLFNLKVEYKDTQLLGTDTLE